MSLPHAKPITFFVGLFFAFIIGFFCGAAITERFSIPFAEMTPASSYSSSVEANECSCNCVANGQILTTTTYPGNCGEGDNPSTGGSCGNDAGTYYCDELPAGGCRRTGTDQQGNPLSCGGACPTGQTCRLSRYYTSGEPECLCEIDAACGDLPGGLYCGGSCPGNQVCQHSGLSGCSCVDRDDAICGATNALGEPLSCGGECDNMIIDFYNPRVCEIVRNDIDGSRNCDCVSLYPSSTSSSTHSSSTSPSTSSSSAPASTSSSPNAVLNFFQFLINTIFSRSSSSPSRP